MKALKIIGTVFFGITLVLLLIYFGIVLSVSPKIISNTLKEANLNELLGDESYEQKCEVDSSCELDQEKEMKKAIMESDTLKDFVVTQTEKAIINLIENKEPTQFTEKQLEQFLKDVIEELDAKDYFKNAEVTKEELNSAIEEYSKEKLDEFNDNFKEMSISMNKDTEDARWALSLISSKGKWITFFLIIVNILVLYLLNREKKNWLLALSVPSLISGISVGAIGLLFLTVMADPDFIGNTNTMDKFAKEIVGGLFSRMTLNGAILFVVGIATMVIYFIFDRKNKIKS